MLIVATFPVASMEFVHNAQGSYAMGGTPDVTPETAEEIFKKPLAIRSAADRTGEFSHFEPGAEPGKYTAGITVKEQSIKQAKRWQRNMPAAWLTPQPRAPSPWPSSNKVRSIDSVHMPEMRGWHLRSQGIAVDKKNGGPVPQQSLWKPSVPPTHARKPRGDRVSENAGFSWDPNARYAQRARHSPVRSWC